MRSEELMVRKRRQRSTVEFLEIDRTLITNIEEHLQCLTNNPVYEWMIPSNAIRMNVSIFASDYAWNLD
jgi:hypothetical protein